MKSFHHWRCNGEIDIVRGGDCACRCLGHVCLCGGGTVTVEEILKHDSEKSEATTFIFSPEVYKEYLRLLQEDQRHVPECCSNRGCH